jgi:hypothetical protein
MDVARLREWNGADSIEQLVNLVDNLCYAYRQASASQRMAIRKIIRKNRDLYSALLYDSIAEVGGGPYLAAIADSKRHEDHASYLDAALTVVSMTEGFGDSRDTILFLDGLWDDAEENRIDPKSHFEYAANLSDTTENRLSIFGGSTKGLILQCVRYSARTGKSRSERDTAASVVNACPDDEQSKQKAWWKLW